MKYGILLSLFVFISNCSHQPTSQNTEATIKNQYKVDSDGIRKVFIDHQNELSACYETALKTQKDLSGKLVPDFDISQGGVVSRAVISQEKSTLTNKALTSCILKEIKSWKFPEPPDKQTVQVFYPLAFSGK